MKEIFNQCRFSGSTEKVCKYKINLNFQYNYILIWNKLFLFAILHMIINNTERLCLYFRLTFRLIVKSSVFPYYVYLFKNDDTI